MKILHIGKYYPPYFGGIEKVNFDLVEGLNQLGVKTDVICFNDKNESEIENNTYSIYRMSRLFEKFSLPFSFSYFFKLRAIINNYDIVHLHLPNPLATIFLLCTNFRGKIVLHWHSDIIKQKFFKKIYIPFDYLIKQKATSIVVTSDNYLNNSDDLKGFKEKCSVIPIGIDPLELRIDKAFLEILKSRYVDKKIIFSLGRLIYYKGFECLIEATKNLSDDTMVLIGGIGPLESKLKNLIKQNNLDHKVKLLGKIPFEHLGAYFQLANLFCLPSTHKSEAFGVVLIEAMSLGCPQLVFNIKGSGVPWVVENKKTGLVVESVDVKSLTDNLNKLISDEVLLKKLRTNSFKRFNTEFKKQKMINKTVKLYNSI
jgi:glycosyltransferase involved in cell wall biosynthesis